MSSSTTTDTNTIEKDLETFQDALKEYHALKQYHASIFKNTADQMQKALLEIHKEGKLHDLVNLHHLVHLPFQAMDDVQLLLEKLEGFFGDCGKRKEGDEKGNDDA